MIRFAPHAEPLQLLIWGTAGLLSVILGTGLAFFLWLRLHDAAPAALVPSIAAIGGALILIALASRRRFEGALLAILAASLLVSFAVASPVFPRLG